MPQTPEQFKTPEEIHDAILTPSEIGALSPRVPRSPETLKDAPKPLEARIYLSDGTEVTYTAEAIMNLAPGTSFVKKGDRQKERWIMRGKAKDGKAVFESESGEGAVMTLNELARSYKPLAQAYVERTKEGREVRLDVEAVLKESVQFYTTHELKDFLRELPKEIRLSPKSETRLKEALKEGFDKAMLLPSPELQKQNIEKLFGELADKEFAGLPQTEQYTKHYMWESDVTKNATPRNRPSRKAYLLLYQSDPLPAETIGKTPNDLDQLFSQKKWNGLTLEEYLMLQRRELESRKNHSFDAYSSDSKQSQWTWLLDSRVPRGVVHASWNPGSRQVKVYWDTPGFSLGRLGARPAVVVEIEL